MPSAMLDDKKKYRCKVCKRYWDNITNLRKHRNVHKLKTKVDLI
jgi:hypothetical protein